MMVMDILGREDCQNTSWGNLNNKEKQIININKSPYFLWYQTHSYTAYVCEGVRINVLTLMEM